MITCSRCGKENQDLYKFCLGCGAKLQAQAAPAPKPASAEEMLPPTPPPEPVVAPAAVVKTAVPPSPPQSMMPAAPPSFGQHYPAASAPAAIPSVQIGIGSIPMQVPARQIPAAATPTAGEPPARPMQATSVPATAVPAAQTPHVSPFSPPATETIACPNCGKQVASAFAFCGGCGHRMKPTPGAVAEAAIQRAEAVAPAPARVGPRGHLTLIRPDGTEGGVFALQEGQNVIGRGQGTLFDADPYLSPNHAEFSLGEAGLEVRDHHSLNGVFVRITEEEPLQSGDCFRIGQELLRFDAINPLTPLEDGTEIIGTPNPGYWGRLSVVVGRDLDGPAFPLFDETARLGRERGDILFPEDGYVSGAHCEITVRDGRVFLKDLRILQRHLPARAREPSRTDG